MADIKCAKVLLDEARLGLKCACENLGVVLHQLVDELPDPDEDPMTDRFRMMKKCADVGIAIVVAQDLIEEACECLKEDEEDARTREQPEACDGKRPEAGDRQNETPNI